MKLGEYKFASEEKDCSPIDKNEIILALNALNCNSVPGQENIHNLLLKNLLLSFIDFLVYLASNSINLSSLACGWKQEIVNKIIKKAEYSSDASKYISLLSCIGKLIERLFKNRQLNFLEQNSILVPQQSGFRKNMKITSS
jgi:transcriptional regulatory protein LevR